MKHDVQRNFLTGVAILLPFALTLWILNILIDLFTYPFLDSLKAFIAYTVPTATGRGLAFFLAKIALLLFVIFVIVLIGYLAQNLFVRSLMRFSDYVLHRIPFVNSLYKGTQDVVQTVFSEEHKHFSQVVLVPFPHAKARCLGLISPNETTDHKISVFVIGTPNPTIGFMLFYEREQLIFLDISVQEAFKFLLSCGIVGGSFKKSVS